jgi:4-hydroxy-tetrahydrodipicolinate synthase
MFEGSSVALVTPFKNSKLNESKIKDLVQFHIKNGTNNLVPCGTTGESPTLTPREHVRVVEIVVKEAKGKVPVIAGAGTNDTKKTIEMVKKVEDLSADGALVITPYYNKPTQEGLYRHFVEVANSTKLPIVIYNVPSRTGVNILPETVARLSSIENIVAIKEASGNLNQVSEIIDLCNGKITVLSGDDSLTLPILSVGGKGVVSVVANIMPKQISEMVSAFLSGNYEKAQRLHYNLFRLSQVLFVETNPGPIKAAMNLAGHDVGNPRLPLVEVSKITEEKISEVLRKIGLM